MGAWRDRSNNYVFPLQVSLKVTHADDLKRYCACNRHVIELHSDYLIQRCFEVRQLSGQHSRTSISKLLSLLLARVVFMRITRAGTR